MKFVLTGRSYSCAVDCELSHVSKDYVTVIRSDNNRPEAISLKQRARNRFLLLEDGFYPSMPDSVQRSYLEKHTGIKEHRVSTQVLAKGAEHNGI